MLDDALVERYSRQILLPEVGGRGQERLCATRVVVTGQDAAAVFAAKLLGRAGIALETASGADGTVHVDLGATTSVGARWHDTGAAVAVLVGRPCVRCVAAAALAAPAAAAACPALRCATAQAVGALVAAETIAVILGLVRGGRAHAFDLARGHFDARELAGTGCAACASDA